MKPDLLRFYFKSSMEREKVLRGQRCVHFIKLIDNLHKLETEKCLAFPNFFLSTTHIHSAPSKSKNSLQSLPFSHAHNSKHTQRTPIFLISDYFRFRLTFRRLVFPIHERIAIIYITFTRALHC